MLTQRDEHVELFPTLSAHGGFYALRDVCVALEKANKHNFEKILDFDYTVMKSGDFTSEMDIKHEVILPLHFTPEPRKSYGKVTHLWSYICSRFPSP